MSQKIRKLIEQYLGKLMFTSVSVNNLRLLSSQFRNRDFYIHIIHLILEYIESSMNFVIHS